MAEEERTIILDVQVNNSAAIKAISDYMQGLDDLKKKEAELKETIKQGGSEAQKAREELAKNRIVQAEYRKGIQELTKEVRNNITEEQRQEGSLASLRAQLSNLTKEYDNLSRAERESAKGTELQNKINAVTDELKGAEEATQRYYRSVGGYEDAINKAIASNVPFIGQIQALIGDATTASGALNNMGKSVASLGKALLALLANPVFAVLAGLAVIIMGITKAINSSEEATARWNAILAPLKRALDFVLSIIQQLAGALLYVFEQAMKVDAWFSELLERIPFLGKYIKDINDANREAIQLERDKYQLAKDTRTINEQNAILEGEIAELRAKAAEKDKYTAQERIAFIDEAIAKERQRAENNKRIAEENLRILEEESKRTENNAAVNDKLSQARIAVTKATTDLNNKMRELNAQRVEAINTINAEAQAEREGAISIRRNAEDAMLALIKEGADKQRTIINNNYNRQIEDLRNKLQTDKNLTRAAREAINQQIIALDKQREQELQKVSDEEIQREAERQARVIEVRLAAVKEGSDAELELKLEQLRLQREAEIRTAEETGVAVADINAKYDKIVTDAQTQAAEARRKKIEDEIRLEWDNRIAEAQLRGEETLQLELERRKYELDSLHQLEGESDAEFKARQLEAQQNYVDAEAAIAEREIQIQQAKLQAASMITGSMADLFETLGEENKAFAIAGKTIALAEILINQGKAIAAGIAQAQSVPFPANIAAIATTVTAILTGITSAIKTVKSAKFAEGGLVTGPGSGTSDSIPAQLSNGESVNNAQSTSMFAPLYSVLNQLGGGIPINLPETSNQAIGENMLARAVAKGVAAMPAPVVSVQEINSVSKRVSVVENLGDA